MVIYCCAGVNVVPHFWTKYVTGENLWLDRGSNPGPFPGRANTLPLSYRATRSYHQQFSTWNLPRLQLHETSKDGMVDCKAANVIGQVHQSKLIVHLPSMCIQFEVNTCYSFLVFSIHVVRQVDGQHQYTSN